ncbi:MAG: molybdopterin-dependent oxidoreductase [Campylobacteraceae bacterium]
MNNFTTCPLDCFDGCSVILENGKLKGDKTHPITKGFLCPHLNNWFNHKRLEFASFDGKKITLDEAKNILLEKLKNTPKEKILFYKGSGNLGLMQNISKLFFSQIGAIVAKGSLCDEAGGVGIEEGRGANLALSPLHVNKSEVVIIWGRDINIANSHMMPALSGKTLITIDVIKTPIAKRSKLFLHVKPKSDIYLAFLLSRIALLEDIQDSDFIKSKTENFEEFKEFIEFMPIVKLSKKCGISLQEIGDFLNIIKGKKVSILVGTAVQRYNFGHSVLRAIDSFAATLGLFGKVGTGVTYLSNSALGFKNPFNINTKRDSLVNADFSKYDLVFIQGANPAVSMPSSLKAISELKKVPFLVYFGLHVNKTSALANLSIPAKSFLEKEDIKYSYGHEYIGFMDALEKNENALSEYELMTFLMDNFDISYKTVKEYIDESLNENVAFRDNLPINKMYEEYPYKSGFYTKSKKFIFLDEFEDLFDLNEEMGDFYCIFQKSLHSLNSQFNVKTEVFVPSEIGFFDNDEVMVKSRFGEAKFIVKTDDDLHKDTILIFAGNEKSNYITPPFTSQKGDCAIFQDFKVTLTKV